MNSKLTFGAIAGTIMGLVLCSSQLAFACGTETDPCSLLTQAQVSAVLGTNVDPAKQVTPTMCGWSAPNQPNSINAKKSRAAHEQRTRIRVRKDAGRQQ